MLTITVQHAIRALAVLAGLPDGNFMLGRQLAKQAEIPANYLSKILWILGSAGFINSARGSGGGYRLQKPAREIRLVDIVDLFEPSRTRTHCVLDGSRECPKAERCAAHRAWHELDCAMNRFLQTTVAEIASDGAGDRSVRHE